MWTCCAWGVGIELGLLILLPLLARLVPHRWVDDDQWYWRRDGLLALLSGVLLVAVGGVWLMTFALPKSTVFTSPDFLEYCGSVAGALTGEMANWSRNRSLLSGWPAIEAARRLGVVDGLLAGGMLGQLLLGIGLYLWGRALHSPLAGMAAVLCAATLAPLAALGRTLTFYPVIVGTLTLATATTAVVWRWPSWRTCAVAGGGAGLAFLIDPRGLLWGLTIVPMVAVAAVSDGRLRRVVPRWLALAIPVWLAWWAGRYAYFPSTSTLETLADLSKGWQHVVTQPYLRAPTTAENGYVWGYSNPLNIPSTLELLASQTVPEEVRNSARTQRNMGVMVDPIVEVVSASALLAVVSLRRRPRMALVLAGGCVPFAVALQGSITARFAGLRFLSNGFPILALLMGMAWATLALGPLPRARTHGRRAGQPWRSIAAIGLLLAVVLGAIPTLLSPTASWRMPQTHTQNVLLRVLNPNESIPKWPECSSRVRAEPPPVWINRLP